MADNVTIPVTGSGDATPIVATDEIGGVEYQRVKIVLGADGSNDGDVSSSNKLPVTLTDTVPVSHSALTELGDAINGSQVDVDLKASDVDLMLGTDFSNVFGASSLVLATQADDLANTSDGIQTTSFLYAFDGTTWDRLRGDSTDGLLVNLGSNNDVTVTGSVTANAGTNLNTSALALESGGNLAGAATSLAIIDDWDESDRAKVNPIAGQAGVQGGSGTVSALTQRVVLATDVALPAGTNAIGKLSANSGVDIGDVDVTSIAAGTNIIGRVGHDITGIGHGVKTVTTAGTDEALAGSTTCKRVVIQAQTDNTSGVAVGATGVDATVATGNGVLLYAGDVFELEIDNLADVYVDSLVNGEGVRYTYFT